MKALIVDDERLARLELRRLLSTHPEIEIVGEAANGNEAVELVRRHAPDLIFLDIEMPGMSGFDLLEQLPDIPDIIFTTAYDQHAVRAFEVNALDYLVKPIPATRLAAALDKVRGRRTVQREQLFLREGERCWIVHIKDIEVLESEGNYTRVFFQGQQPLIAGSLAAFEQRLGRGNFFRANRKNVINLDAIETSELGPADNLVVRMRCGQSIALSRRQSVELRKILAV
jgi:two-component system LytT family response regulator